MFRKGEKGCDGATRTVATGEAVADFDGRERGDNGGGEEVGR